MIRCPKCNAKIDALIHTRSGTAQQKCWLRGELIDYDSYVFEGDGRVLEYYCPECYECLFTSEPDAIEFLKQ